MASFRWHISVGIALGFLGALALGALALVDAPAFLLVVTVAAVLGSVLPDMDSDSGIPFHVSFASFALVAAALTGSSAYQETEGDWEQVAVWAVGTFFFVYGAVGPLMKRYTRHRGMAHSLPATLLLGLVTFFVAVHFSFSDMEAFVVALAIMAGYASHLILDEIYAAVNFHGIPFVPNKAFGSALKLKSHDPVTNVLVYGAILFLLAGNLGRFVELGEAFWRSVSA